MYYFDPLYLLYALPAFVIGLVAQILLTVWTRKYQKVQPMNNFTGVQVVEKIANNQNFNISLALTKQNLGDNYNPITHTLTLSEKIATTSSITSVGIAAHELGHVAQHQNGSILMSIRTTLVPTLNISTQIGYIMLIIGVILGITNLAWLGIILFSGTTLFSFLTLPIEIDASRRALNLLIKENILTPQELPGVKKVLSAAALTYIAATVQSIGTLLYFILRVKGIRSRD